MTEIDKQVVFFPPKELAITRVIDAWEANSDNNSDREDELTKALDALVVNHLTERLRMTIHLLIPCEETEPV